MQGPNRTHAKPGVSAGQARAVQDKARDMGFNGTMRDTDSSNEENGGNEANDGNEANGGNDPNNGNGSNGGNKANRGNNPNNGNEAKSESATADQK